jgi:hypothetical protein
MASCAQSARMRRAVPDGGVFMSSDLTLTSLTRVLRCLPVKAVKPLGSAPVYKIQAHVMAH